jgi:tRNA(Ile)-lysidine synthase TilS/MesJ
MIKLDRIKLLASELFSYSYDHYADHVEGGNERFTKLMPNDVRVLIKALEEKWSENKISEELKIDINEVNNYLARFEVAKKIVDASNPSESFRNSIRDIVEQAAKDRLTNEEIDQLVIQICYRTADLGYLLDLENSKLSDYSEWLRRDKGVDYSGVDLPNLE